MRRKYAAMVVFCALLFAAVGSLQAAVITVTTVQKITPDGVEPAEWECTNGWSIVTNMYGVGKIMVSGPAYCEAKYQPYVAYELENAAASRDFPRWEYVLDPPVGGDPIPKYNMGRGAFYASCDMFQGQNAGASTKTPSTVWLGTDTHAGQPLAGVKLSQIKTAKYCTFVSRNPTSLASGVYDKDWDSWKQAWYNPRFPISLQITCEGPGGRKQFWYRPWGNDTFIGDCASDGRLGIWEEHIAIDQLNYPSTAYGRWLSPNGIYEEYGTTQYESWADIVAQFGDYTLVATDTAAPPYGWKSPGYKGATDPPGNPLCTATGKCLNFEVGARFWRLLPPGSGSYRTWHPESRGFRGQMDYFVLEIDRNEDGDVNDPGESAIYDFEPAANDAGPQIVYINQSCLIPTNDRDTLIEKRGEPDVLYDDPQTLGVVENPERDTKEKRLYDVLFKVSGKVTQKLNAFFAVDDGANLSLLLNDAGQPLTTRIYTLDDRDSSWNPYNPAEVGQYWESWGLLERFRATGSQPWVTKPFIVWTSKSHNRKLLN